MRTPACLILLLLSTGCFGGLENDPLRPGETSIAGRLSEPIAVGRGWVSIVGHEALSSTVADDGSFRIDHVPSGTVELAASTGLGRAGRVMLTTYAERAIKAEIALEPALVVSGRVVLESGFGDGTPARVRILGLPVHALTDPSGHFSFDSLPEGCHQIVAEHAGFLPLTENSCGQSGEQVAVNHHLRSETAHAGDLCAPCQSAADCGSALCVANGTEQVCSQSCDVMHPCPGGYGCAGGACLPPHSSCTAVLDLHDGTACTMSTQCGLVGTDDGVCGADQHCTVRCESSHDCTAGRTCAPAGPEMLCQ